MNQRPEKAIFEEVALLKQMDPSFVEKDWFVTQAIRIIAGIDVPNFEVIFSGGTALSKAFGLLERFSEDSDFRVIANEEFRTRKALSDFRLQVVESLRDHGFAFEDTKIKARDQNRFFSIDLDYTSYFSQAAALRPHIQIEVTARNTQLPQLYMPVSSFVNTLSRKPPEVARIGCINPVESAADKLSALAWRIPDRLRGSPYDDPALVRHIHDLALLKDSALAHEKFASLVAFAMAEDNQRPKNNPDLLNISAQEKFRLMLQILDTDAEYAAEYDLFVKGVSYAAEGKIPNFTSAVGIVRELVMAITV
jgi:hypothetical protein